MKENLRFKYLYKDYFDWKELEFLRQIRSHQDIQCQVFHEKKITKIEQEHWFYDTYCKDEEYTIYLVYSESRECIVSYVTLHHNILNNRLQFDYFVSPEFSFINYDDQIMKWIINKSILEEVHKLWSYILIDNTNKIKIFTKHGLKFEFCIKDFILKNGKYINVNVMSLINLISIKK